MGGEGSEENAAGEELEWEDEVEVVGEREERNREMALVNKPKKGKRKIRDSGEREITDSRKAKTKDPSKVKRAKSNGSLAALPADLRGPDTEWWYAFLTKHAELHKDAESGIHLPNQDLALSISPKPRPFPICCTRHQIRSNRQPIFF
jgi:hypothetical protein